MRKYPHEMTIRMGVIHLLEMYNTGMFRDGRRSHVYDQRFINLLLVELVGLDDIENGTPIDDITKKFMYSKLNLLNIYKIIEMYANMYLDAIEGFLFLLGLYKYRVGNDAARLKKFDFYVKKYIKEQGANNN